MNWSSRLRAQITLEAPDGARFTAFWQGDEVELPKQIAQFNLPLFDGTIVQDLGSRGLAIPLTLYFEGDDHDREALAFLRALKQRGSWTVSHPVYGGFSLQPISARLAVEPVSSANLTKVESSWIEPAAADLAASTAELGAQISVQVDAVNQIAASQFETALDLSDPEGAAAAMEAGTRCLSQIKAGKLQALIKRATDLQATFTSYYEQAQAAFTSTPMDVLNAAGQSQAILLLPALVSGDLTAKTAALGDFAERILDTLIPSSDVSARNGAAVGEMFLSGALSGAAASVATSVPETREQAVQAVYDLGALLRSITAGLDAMQSASAGNAAAEQYFSQGGTFAALARLIGLAAAYLLRLIFDLKVAKRFTLDRPRAPIEITISEYGDLGPSDSYLDLFIASNHLRSDEIILLQAGREVVVYV